MSQTVKVGGVNYRVTFERVRGGRTQSQTAPAAAPQQQQPQQQPAGGMIPQVSVWTGLGQFLGGALGDLIAGNE